MSGNLPITRVTVHRDGALVTRSGRLAARDGLVEVTHLPLLLDASSLRVELDGARLLDVRLDLDVSGAHRGQETQAIEALDAARLDLARLEARRAQLVRERRSVDAVVPASPTADPERVPDATRVAGWVALQDALAHWAEALDDRIRPLELEIRQATEKVRICEHTVQTSSSEAVWRRWAPTRRALIRSEGASEVLVTLSYRVLGAFWTPAYALHADATYRRGRLVLRALVAQDTGEDWSGVRMLLSTAPCRRVTQIPELPALRLGTAQAQPPRSWRDLPADLETLFPSDLSVAVSVDTRVTVHTETTVTAANAPALDPVEDSPSPKTDIALPPSAPPPARAPAPAPQPLSGGAMPRHLSEPMAAPVMKRSGGLFSAIGDALSSQSAPSQSRDVEVFGDLSPGAASHERAKYEPAVAASIAAEEPSLGQAPVGLDVEDAVLDYPGHRLRPWDAPAGERGRLRRADLEEEAREAAIPLAGIGELKRAIQRSRAAARGVVEQNLPPHHVLPGPIEGVDACHEAQDAVDVRSDGRFHSVAVFSRPMDLSVRFRIVSGADSRPFRTVNADLAEAVPLLPGPVDVFVDGALEISTPWAGSALGKGIAIGLGVEDRLRVARNVRHREESAGIFGGERRLHTEIELQIASGLSRETEIEILSRIPVASGDGVAVQLVDSKPPADPYKGEPDGPILEGGLRQVVRVPPGGQMTATLHYAVTLGNRYELVGGDRRG